MHWRWIKSFVSFSRKWRDGAPAPLMDGSLHCSSSWPPTLTVTSQRGCDVIRSCDILFWELWKNLRLFRVQFNCSNSSLTGFPQSSPPAAQTNRTGTHHTGLFVVVLAFLGNNCSLLLNLDWKNGTIKSNVFRKTYYDYITYNHVSLL